MKILAIGLFLSLYYTKNQVKSNELQTKSNEKRAKTTEQQEKGNEKRAQSSASLCRHCIKSLL